jgi:autotransporter-associated beta strand protein
MKKTSAITNQSRATGTWLLLSLLLLALTPAVHAQNKSWDPLNTPSTGSDGPGTWDNSSLNWTNNGVDVAWPASPLNTDIAFFGLSANTTPNIAVTVNQSPNGITNNQISFRDMTGSGSYNIGGSGAAGTINIDPANFFTIQAGAGGTNQISAPIAGTMNSGKVFVVNRPASTSGKLILSGANTFTPGSAVGIAIRQGTVLVSSINTVGSVTNNNGGISANQSSSCLGAAVAGKAGISLGYNGYPATLIYTGSGEGTDRQISIGAGTPVSGCSATIQNDGSGPLVFATNFVTPNSVNVFNRVLTLQGANTGLNEIKGSIPDGSPSNTVSLAKAGAGTWFLSGSNSYSGGTTITAGVLKINSDTSLGNIPTNGSPASVVVNNSTLYFAGTNGSSYTINSNRTIALGPATGQNSGFLQLDTGVTVNIPGILTNNGAGVGSLYIANNSGQNAAGTLVLSGSNTFSGTVLNRATILSVSSINTIGNVTNNNGGTTAHSIWSSLGAPATYANSQIQLGYNGYTGTLLYTGAGEGSDRNLQIGGGTGAGGGAIIQNDGTGPLVLAGTNITSLGTASANKTLMLQGSNTGFNEIKGALTDASAPASTTNLLSLTKAGTGTWVLSASNTYSGATTISGGILEINGDNSQALGNVTVQTNATLGGAGTIGGAVTVNKGGILSPGANGIGTLTLNSNLTISGNLYFELNKSLAQSNDIVNVVGVLTNAGTGTLTFTNVGAAALTAGDSFKLFSQPLQNGTNLVLSPSTPGLNLAWTNKLAIDGSIGVVPVAIINPNPPVLQVSYGSGTLSLAWPTNAGWILQSNSVSLTTPSAWFNYPADGSVTVTNVTISVDPAKINVFYRMLRP